MNSLVVDLGYPPSNGLAQGRKQIKASVKERERSCFRLRRLIVSRRIGVLFAFFISGISLLMIFNITSRVTAPKTGSDSDLSPDMLFHIQRQNFNTNDIQLSGASSPLPLQAKIGEHLTPFLSKVPTAREQLQQSKREGVSAQKTHSYWNGGMSLDGPDYSLHPDHPCQGFTIPPPPADKKRTGPRPCPVCYIPMKDAVDAMPVISGVEPFPIKQLSYVEEPLAEGIRGINFGGHPSLEDRTRSYQVQAFMKIHCGFAHGVNSGAGSGFEIEVADQIEMDRCTGIVVASAIYGNYDQLHQPTNISKKARKTVCFFMFVDEETHQHLDIQEIDNGVWKIVVVHNLPYRDARRNGKVPKLLLHRLFPNARFSVWIDGKLKLVVDPYQILERFLWRHNNSFAISRHYKRFDVFEEAEANKAAGKYNNASINAQVDFYRSEGLLPYDRSKSIFPSDVPEGCVILREHTPVTNLFSCLWFNEVDRFTSRDQLSFAMVRDKLMEVVPFQLGMFLDCERRNFVVQEYHRDVLEQRKSRIKIPVLSAKNATSQMSKPAGYVSSIHSETSRSRPTSRRRKKPSSRRRIESAIMVEVL